MWTKKVRYGPPSTESKRGGAERKEEEEDFSLSVVCRERTLHHRPRSSWTGPGEGGGQEKKKAIAPPTPSLPSSSSFIDSVSHFSLIASSNWILFNSDDAVCWRGMPAFRRVHPVFSLPPPSRSFSLIQSLALDYHSSQRRVELLLIELYAVYSVVFAPAHRVVLAARHGWTTPRFHNSFIICWRLFWTLRSLPLTPDSLCDPC